jgi:hypothetical protein
MTDEHRFRWTDERLTGKFAELDSQISETKQKISSDISELKKDFDDKHASNQRNIDMLGGGQVTIQDSLRVINEKQNKSLLLLSQIVGDDGKPDEGRLGKLEVTVETLTKFRWQLMAVASAAVAILEFLRK